MRRFSIVIALLLAACAASPSARPEVDITVTAAGNGEWVADYRFARPSPAWLFPLSRHTSEDKAHWRPRDWSIETKGVRFERRGDWDLLVADKPIRAVRIRLKPTTQDLAAANTPAVAFSDGGLALYTDQFDVRPLPDAAAAQAMTQGVSAGLRAPTSRLTLRRKGPILFQGKVVQDQITTGFVRSYAYFGRTPVHEGPAFASIVDPGLPPWLRDELDGFLPKLLSLYGERLGALEVRPTAFVTWNGSPPGGSLDGFVVPNLVVLNLGGTRFKDPVPAGLERVRWFLAHEGAHFWLGQKVQAQRQSDSWITEGGAEILAMRATEQLTSGYSATPMIEDGISQCLAFSRPNQALSGAFNRGEHQAYYGCGMIFYLAAEAKLRQREPGSDIFTFVRRLAEGDRTDTVVTADEWLAAFEAATADPAMTADVRKFINEGVEDPRAFVTRLFAASGVQYGVAN